MRNAEFVKIYPQTPYDEREILRYAGFRGEADEGVKALLKECLCECENAFEFRVCAKTLSKTEFFQLFGDTGERIKEYLFDCEYVLLFAGTVGLGVDRLVNRYAEISAVRALLFQAIGAERIESLCDAFCKDICGQAREKGWETKPRFSPGYGDFPLEAQTEFFRALDCPRKLGLTLTDGFLMCPTKSVTALIGLGKGTKTEKTGCAVCSKKDCSARKETEI